MKQTITRLVDDLDGSDAAETVQFGWGAVDYTIDLSEVHAKELRNALDPYVRAGAKLGRTGTAPARPAYAARRDRNQEIRDWAKAAGKSVAERGRIPAQIIDEWRARAA